MVIKANKYSIDELSKVNVESISSISIEIVIEHEKAEVLKGLLRLNQRIRVVLIIDPAVDNIEGRHCNLRIVEALGDFKHLTVLAFGSQQLQNIDELCGLGNLTSFGLDGNYKKEIDLEPLKNTSGIEELALEFGFANAQQMGFASNLSRLRRLRISTFDLKKVQLNPGLQELAISNTIKHPELLASAFPDLKSLSINLGKGLSTFDFIASLHALEYLQIAHTNKVKSLPKMDMPAVLKSLSLVATKEFEDIDSILQFSQLEELKITEPTRIPVADFTQLGGLKNLRKVQVVFKTESEDDAFRQIAEANGWSDI
ncbi:hypothetical protein [Niabella beijingensis]|uniref:hypothetical protein n=1 Tax=Niabella beijingensis TaxID=2872700 RepID=UPI001CBC8D44|nr:hypothetical protein [Niabella beijingensis]MBZ4191925.1 hypothetical protein [Niabella beijingensis]